VRAFWRGDSGRLGALAARLCGSEDLYGHRRGGQPAHSINFITSHDGFTLYDLTAYAEKHNEANGEENRDGEQHNLSCNHGIEGPSDDPAVEAARLQHMKNLLATLLFSRGVPMLTAGDEFARTQQGNNNAYCQDNALSWVDWSLPDRNCELTAFVQRLIALRKKHPPLRRNTFHTPETVQWLGPGGGAPDWEHGKQLAAVIESQLCMLINNHTDPARFELPPGAWQVELCTAPEPATVPREAPPHSITLLSCA
jgi:glycogen operon protein